MGYVALFEFATLRIGGFCNAVCKQEQPVAPLKLDLRVLVVPCRKDAENCTVVVRRRRRSVVEENQVKMVCVAILERPFRAAENSVEKGDELSGSNISCSRLLPLVQTSAGDMATPA